MEATIHGHPGILDVAAADGYVHLQVREDLDGPVLAGVTLDPTPLAAQETLQMAFCEARQQRREQKARTDRAMKVLLGDTTGHNALIQRLQGLVETGRIDVDLEVGEAVERLRTAAPPTTTQPPQFA